MTIGNRVAILREKFAQSIGLPFAEILTESEIEQALQDEGIAYRKRLFCPIVTLWAWISRYQTPYVALPSVPQRDLTSSNSIEVRTTMQAY